MKILIISPKNKTVFNFRGDLIKDMIQKGNKVYVTGPNEDYLSEIYNLGVEEFSVVPLVKDNTSIIGDLNYILRLKKEIKKIKPDIVFSYNIKPVIYGSIAAKTEGVKHIYAMVTGLGRVYASKRLKAKVLRIITTFLYKIAFSCCDKVIFQNHDDVDELTNYRCLVDKKAVVVNGSGVNMQRFKKTEMPNSPVFLMVSRIIREKGIIEYCEAARMLKKEYPEAKCILLGGFDSSIGAIKKEEIEEYIEDNSIQYLGEVKSTEEFYGKSSVFVLPSYYREGLPRTILEAMSCGRPIITTDWVGCREPIENGKNGFLIPIKDPNYLCSKMLYLCDMRIANIMGDNAYETCLKKYDVSVVNSQMKMVIGY